MKFFNAALLSVATGLFGVFAFFFPITEGLSAAVVKSIRIIFGVSSVLFAVFAFAKMGETTKNLLNIMFLVISTLFAIANIVLITLTVIG